MGEAERKKKNEAVGTKNRLMMDEGRKRIVCPFRRKKFWKYIGCVLSALTYEKKGHKPCIEIPKDFCRTAPTKLQRNVFAKTPIYIKYVVITIVIFTFTLAIELFYLTQLCSLLGYFFE